MKKLVDFYARRYRAILIVGLILTVLSGWVASGLSLDADLERLLPESAPSVKGLRELEKSYGIVGRSSIVLSSKNKLELKEGVKELSKILLDVPHIRRSEFERPVSFFRAKRLVYIEKVDLEEISKRIKKRLKWEKQRANPLFMDLGGSKRPEVKVSDIEKKYDSMSESARFCNAEETECVLFLYPDFSSSDLVKSRQLNTTLRDSLVKYQKVHPEINFGLTGRYKKRVDQSDALIHDLLYGTGLAVFLLLVFLLLYFRGFVTSLIVFVPLVVGTIWSFAYARIAFGSLNILTGFFGAVLLGLGIDYGIHMVSRYLESRERMDLKSALVDTLNSAGRASVYAGLTTIVAFGSLMVSDFVAFFEYGAIALGGIALIVLANMTILPCILILISDFEFDLKPTMSVAASEKTIPLHRFLRRHRTPLLFLFFIGALVSIWGLKSVEYEYDFSKIQTTNLESWRLDDRVDRLMKVSQAPAIFLVKNDIDAEKVAQELRSRKANSKEGWTIDKVVTRRDVLPKEQKEKRKILEDLLSRFKKLPKKVIKGEVRDFYEEIRNLLKEKPVEFSDLPLSIRSPLTQSDGHVVVVFTTISQHNSEEMATLAKVIRNIRIGGRKIDGINDTLLLVDIMESVKKDSVLMVGLTIFGLILVAIFAFRRPKKVFLLLLTIGFATLFAFGMTGLFEIKFNFINMLIVPIWVGLGVDAAFHLMVRAEEAPHDTQGFLATGFAVSAAFVTSMIGFGSMLTTDHGGLYSMGLIAMVGLGTILIVSFFIQLLAFKGEEK